ncbi:hypothetical protein L211DRAFT_776448 [Terfezia boudieri ATCC MYA-4762]|uniref:Nab2-like CCCH zinc finger domain-containing protein n=1 Tax=Terfezia boudieri ATCC MYA-4762 TaxID=1051890 RepID=A0A3N4M1R1_9PEZI|nr:hypothetical protein L211DRAFT_776448 [Terfezia boudieri ATCC MYA-4762]
MSIALNTPLAEALNAAIQEKLVEIGWSVPGEDTSPLSEYICLMLVNGKSQEQIAEELSGDLLGLSKEDDSATVFSGWLFAKVEQLGKETGGGQAQGEVGEEKRVEEGGDATTGEQGGGPDVDMGGDNGIPPTGPKAMRSATGPRKDRLFNQINRAMDRSMPDNLRRVRPQPGERIEKREPPKGPRAGPNGPRLAGLTQPGPMGAVRGGPVGRGNGIGRGGPGFGVGPVPPHLAAQLATMNPQQQMAFYQMIEQQNQILAGFMAQGFQPGMMMPQVSQMSGLNGYRGPPHQQFPNQFNPHQQQRLPQGASLFERIETPPQAVTPQRQNHVQNGVKNGEENVAKEVRMETDEPFFQDAEGVKPEEEDPFKTACKFANNCTKPDCPFAHPTPVAIGRVSISFVEGKCPFGVSCKNRKCIGAHPSPASGAPRPPKIQADCKFFPNCTNPVCPFRHPDMPLCRNGTNCTRPDCHFTHAEVPACKFNPCLNPTCIFTHTEGQQQGAFDHKVWTAGGPKKEHVSERKFTVDGGEEELIIPGQEPRKRKVGETEQEEQKPPGSAASTDSSHTMHADMETAREEELAA